MYDVWWCMSCRLCTCHDYDCLTCVMLCYVILYYVMLCSVTSYAIIWLCMLWNYIYDIDDIWCVNLHTPCHINYVKYDRYETSIMYACLFRLTILWTNGGLTCIINLCHDYKLWESHVFILHVHRDTFPLGLVRKFTLRYLCLLWYYTDHFLLWTLLAWVCALAQWARPMVRIWARMVGPCVGAWTVGRKVLHIQSCSNWKVESKTMT